MCCGGKRAALRQQFQQSTVQPSEPARVQPVHVETTSTLIRGPVTGRHYQLRGGVVQGDLDPRDSAALVKSGLLS